MKGTIILLLGFFAIITIYFYLVRNSWTLWLWRLRKLQGLLAHCCMYTFLFSGVGGEWIILALKHICKTKPEESHYNLDNRAVLAWIRILKKHCTVRQPQNECLLLPSLGLQRRTEEGNVWTITTIVFQQPGVSRVFSAIRLKVASKASYISREHS